MTNDVISRLALACAHGTRQKALVGELLQGTAYIVPTFWGFSIGGAEVGSESWRNLKKRLKQNGFVVSQETSANKTGKYRKVTMKFEVDFTSP